MEILNKKDINICSLSKLCEANKSYVLSLNFDGGFHIRICLIDVNNNIISYLTNTIFSEAGGSFKFKINIPKDGILAIEKSPDRINAWHKISDIIVRDF